MNFGRCDIINRMINIRGFFCALVCFWVPTYLYADVLDDARDALNVAKIACAGIADEISRVSGMATAGVATNAVGAVASGAAVGVGVAKSAEDKQSLNNTVSISCSFETVYNMDDAAALDLIANMGDLYSQRSKRLGNWRTGLMAGAGATHIASAVLGGINVNQSELAQHVTACNNALNQLRIVQKQMASEGVSPFTNPIRQQVTRAIDVCMDLDVADVEKIEKKEKAVLGTSATGAAVAIAGVITSASANSDKLRSAMDDKEKKKFNNLNTASNALAGVSGAGAVMSTVFNASLIKLTRQMVQTARECEGALAQ